MKAIYIGGPMNGQTVRLDSTFRIGQIWIVPGWVTEQPAQTVNAEEPAASMPNHRYVLDAIDSNGVGQLRYEGLWA